MERSKRKTYFINCSEANHFCDKNQYKEASFWEKIKLNIHLIYCSACRQYSANNARLTKLLRDPKFIMLTSSEKNKIKKQLKEKTTKK